MRSWESILESEPQLHTFKLERIPNIADTRGGLTPEFASFYESVTRAIVTRSYGALYQLSDKSLQEDEFIQLIETTYGSFYKQFDCVIESSRGLDVELNLDSLKTIHRNILNSIYVLAYTVTSNDCDILDHKKYKLTKYHTEIFFTYKDNQFCIVSVFSPFIVDEDEI